jgi:PIN domain nuclease of toxin-antitoxin system
LNDLVARLQSNANYEIVPLDLDIVRIAERIENVPELFDRMILATALRYQAALLSRDAVFQGTDSVEIVW